MHRLGAPAVLVVSSFAMTLGKTIGRRIRILQVINASISYHIAQLRFLCKKIADEAIQLE